MSQQMISVLEGLMTFMSHAVAAIYLSPVKFSRKKLWFFWGVFIVALTFAGAIIIPVLREQGQGSLLVFGSLYIAHILVYFITTKGKFMQRLFMFISYASFFCSACMLSDYCRFFLLVERPEFMLILHGMFLIAANYMLLVYFRKVVADAARYIDKEWNVLCMWMGMFLILLVSLFVYPSQIDKFTKVQATGLLLLILLLVGTYGVFFLCLRNISAAGNMKQTRLHMELLEERVEVQGKAIADARKIRHDIRHHNLTLLRLAEKGGIKPVVDYLYSMEENISEGMVETWCRNDILNSIFAVYSQKAVQQGIKCEILADVEKEITVKPSDFVAIVANLFENAIHGAALSGKDTPYVSVKVFHKSEKLVVRIENDCLEDMNFDEMPVEQYGIGLLSVFDTIKEYEGEMFLTAKEGSFKAIVLLNL